MKQYWVVDVVDEDGVFPVYEDRVFDTEEEAQCFAASCELQPGEETDVAWVTESELEEMWDGPVKIINGIVSKANT